MANGRAASQIGGGIGAGIGVLIVDLGARVGLGTSDAAALAAVIVGACAWLGVSLGRIWSDPGILPWLRRGFRGRDDPPPPEE